MIPFHYYLMSSINLIAPVWLLIDIRYWKIAIWFNRFSMQAYKCQYIFQSVHWWNESSNLSWFERMKVFCCTSELDRSNECVLQRLVTNHFVWKQKRKKNNNQMMANMTKKRSFRSHIWIILWTFHFMSTIMPNRSIDNLRILGNFRFPKNKEDARIDYKHHKVKSCTAQPLSSSLQ